MANKKFSSAQLAAQKLFAERARAGTLTKGKRKANPDKSKPGVYVKRVSQATGVAPSKRLMTRRKKALTAPAGYFPNPEPTHLEIISVYKTPSGKVAMKITYHIPSDRFSYIGEYGAGSGATYSQMKKAVLMMMKYHPRVTLGSGENFITLGDPIGKRRTNPDKSKPRAYVKRVSQATGLAPSKRLMTRRKKALTAPAGYFPNPKSTGMMKAYQVVCMHPKKHVVGVFKTLAEAKRIAGAMANADNAKYGIIATRIHKTHFAV